MKPAKEILYDNLSERQAGIISKDQYIEEWISDAMKEYAKQVAQQALNDAAENAGVITRCPVGFGIPVGFECKADKDSILKTEIKLP